MARTHQSAELSVCVWKQSKSYRTLIPMVVNYTEFKGKS